jgi:serine/threonine protein kinase
VVIILLFYLRLGIEYLHANKISHRDIKPENLLLESDFNLVIADFGSAAVCKTSSGGSIEFDSSVIVGSQEYNAPEINMDKNYYGEKADLFSAGVCLFIMVVGCPPFRMAGSFDPYFVMLSEKKFAAYWSIFSSAKASEEFKGIS